LISATYSVRTVKRLFTGAENAQMKDVPDMRPSEVLAASILVFAIFSFGFYPQPLLDLITPTVKYFLLTEPVAVLTP